MMRHSVRDGKSHRSILPWQDGAYSPVLNVRTMSKHTEVFGINRNVETG
ncbi:protein of unknown function [Methylotuvimicrobium alcaliphilum 20Z]|uniref:Uncharacterized protein n=1 Tax=Methylotuvimicrobium alcaliphilum (strain DSM 19304 / NCIMB 14124 / VKM B-2133 / 20Z) TaxID=1091494 RepID=G4SYR6_META2|nr:protein of unknown function [Methylotuvimicrobium alcaliphilum 20Z]